MQKPDALITEENILSVTDLSLLLKGVVEGAFARVRIKGELSGVKKASSGHIYFSLKDETAILDAVSWRGQNSSFAHLIRDGLEVVCLGKITTYPMRSNYQIVVESLEMAGEGALLKLLEELKKKLLAEGLFNSENKKSIPYLPKVIGVVTSPTGAVIRDIIHRISDRFPLNILLWPVAVQGEEAAKQVAEAVKGFNAIPSSGGIISRPDVIIVARGGGSIEDLWAFNEEEVVRAVFESDIPVISAVGHETDTTLIDYVSDLRAPTPTGAAELAVPVLAELILLNNKAKARMDDAVYRLYKENCLRLESLTKGIPNLSELVEMYVQRLDEKVERLFLAMHNYIRAKIEIFNHFSQTLELCSYNKVLERGFALVVDEKGALLANAKVAKQKELMQIRFFDGEVDVQNVAGENPPKTKLSKKLGLNVNQGDLFG